MKAHLTFKPNDLQQKVMKEEINRQILKNIERREDEYDAMVMYVLHSMGWGAKRLKRFHKIFKTEHQKFIEEFGNDYSFGQMCIMQLLKIGVDIEEWNKE